MHYLLTRKKNILIILTGAEEILLHKNPDGCKWQIDFLSSKVTNCTLQDAREVAGVPLKTTFLLVHKKGHALMRASVLLCHRDSILTGGKERDKEREYLAKYNKLLSARGELGQMSFWKFMDCFLANL